jgi:murein endopeptidase
MLVRRRIGDIVAAGSTLVAVATAFSVVPLATARFHELNLTLADASAMTMPSAPVTRAVQASPMIDAKTAHPLDGVQPLEILRLIREEPQKIGSASLGFPTRGALWGGVQLQPGAYIEPASSDFAWGTQGVISAIELAAAQVNKRFPKTPKLFVGDISNRHGGWLRPHRSHQSGLDADVGFYYLGGAAWYQPATGDNLDVARTWALVKALMDHGNVEYMFMDRTVQTLLHEHAKQLGEDPMLMHDVFQSEDHSDTVIRHAAGHISHFHVRFEDPLAVETGARIYPLLQGNGLVRLAPPPRAPQRGRIRVRYR